MTTPARQELEYADHVAALRRQDAALADDLAAFTGVGQVVEWMQRRGLAQARVDLIGQDEFHYDFLIEMTPGGRWLALGVTWLGSLTAVAVWTQKPTPDELLARRLESGWTPTPTRLQQQGDVILGHAACLKGHCDLPQAR